METSKSTGELNAEDYQEPRCLLNMNQGQNQGPVRSVPMDRIIEKLDEYLGRNNWGAAERHLDYWLEDALSGGDLKGALAIQGERMGLFRKKERREEAMEAVSEALKLLEETGMEDSLTGATTYVNIATVYKTFYLSQEALPYFEKARAIYERDLKEADSRLGGLYNNMALALADLSRFQEARTFYEKALAVMEKISGGALEEAVTYLNLADLAAAEQGFEAAEEQVMALLDRGLEKIHTPSLPRDGYFAYVCETCAPCFRHYGRFADADELDELSQTIYAGY